jgi:hypothetical protein
VISQNFKFNNYFFKLYFFLSRSLFFWRNINVFNSFKSPKLGFALAALGMLPFAADAASISGQVTQNGLAYKGATVKVVDQQHNSAQVITTTEGQYIFSDMDLQGIDLSSFNLGVYPNSEDDDALPVWKVRQLMESDQDFVKDIAIPDGFSKTTFSIVDEQGSPLAGVRVKLSSRLDSSFFADQYAEDLESKIYTLAEGVTDSNGQVSLPYTHGMLAHFDASSLIEQGRLICSSIEGYTRYGNTKTIILKTASAIGQLTVLNENAEAVPNMIGFHKSNYKYSDIVKTDANGQWQGAFGDNDQFELHHGDEEQQGFTIGSRQKAINVYTSPMVMPEIQTVNALTGQALAQAYVKSISSINNSAGDRYRPTDANGKIVIKSAKSACFNVLKSGFMRGYFDVKDIRDGQNITLPLEPVVEKNFSLSIPDGIAVTDTRIAVRNDELKYSHSKLVSSEELTEGFSIHIPVNSDFAFSFRLDGKHYLIKVVNDGKGSSQRDHFELKLFDTKTVTGVVYFGDQPITDEAVNIVAYDVKTRSVVDVAVTDHLGQFSIDATEEVHLLVKSINPDSRYYPLLLRHVRPEKVENSWTFNKAISMEQSFIKDFELVSSEGSPLYGARVIGGYDVQFNRYYTTSRDVDGVAMARLRVRKGGRVYARFQDAKLASENGVKDFAKNNFSSRDMIDNEIGNDRHIFVFDKALEVIPTKIRVVDAAGLPVKSTLYPRYAEFHKDGRFRRMLWTPGRCDTDTQALATVDVSIKPSSIRYDYKYALYLNPHSSIYSSHAVIIENPGIDAEIVVPYANYAKGSVELPSGIVNNDSEYIDLQIHSELRRLSNTRAKVVHNFSNTSVAEFTLKVPVGVELKSKALTRSAYQGVLEYESKDNMYYGQPGESVDFVGGQFGSSTIQLLPASILMGRIVHPGEGSLAHGALAKVEVLDNANGALLAAVWSDSSTMGTAHESDQNNTFAQGYFHVNIPNVQKVKLRISYHGLEEVLTGAISLDHNKTLDLGDIYLTSSMEDELAVLMAFESTLSDKRELKTFRRLTKQALAVFAVNEDFQQGTELVKVAGENLNTLMETLAAHNDLIEAAAALKARFDALIVSSDIEADNGTVTWENDLSEGATALINESLRKLNELLTSGEDSNGDRIVWIDDSKQWLTFTHLQMLILPELETIMASSGSNKRKEEAAARALAGLDILIPSFNGAVAGIGLSEAADDFILEGSHSKLFYLELAQIKSSIFSALK